MRKPYLTGFAIALSSLVICATAQAAETAVVVQKNVIVTPAPKALTCTTVAAHWEDNVWVAEQSVCKYEGRAEGVEWVQDYWACTVFTADGQCTTWDFRPGHWVQQIKQ
jgi:hypothetical protein